MGVEVIVLRPVGGRRLEVYQAFVLASLAFATLLGFVLALLLPLGRALGWGLEGSRPELISIHGQVQLIGFGGLFVMGMALRLTPRFSGVHLRFEGLIYPGLALIVAGLIVRALVAVPFADRPQGVLISGAQISVLVGAILFATVILATLTQKGSRADATGYMFAAGTIALVASALIAALVAIDEAWDNQRVFSYLPTQAILHLQIAGFLIAFIAGVGTRAVPTMVGLPRPVLSVKALAGLLAGSVTITALSYLAFEYVSSSEILLQAAAAGLLGLGPVLISVAWLTGVFRPAANRLRPASQSHIWLVRSAMAWLIVAGVLCIYYGGRAVADSTLPSQFEMDAIRHALGVGVVTAMIMGMALMIVPEFAGERMAASRQRYVSYALLVLVNLATVFRVAPAIAGFDWTAEVRAWSMAVGGGAAQAAILLFALSFLRLFVRQGT